MAGHTPPAGRDVTAPLNLAGPGTPPRGSASPTVAAGVNAGNAAKDGHDAVSVPLAVPAPAAPLVVGLDLSLTATGVAHMRGHQVITDTITPPANRRAGLLRLRWLRGHLLELIGAPALVVVEGPSYGSTGAGQHDRAGLYWLILDGLWGRGVPVAVAPPANVKRYATGAGGGPRASKDAVLLAAARRFPSFDGDNNAADALWLAAMGTDRLTGATAVPAAHREALAKCTWPAAGVEW